jgi:hypothetical protein
MRASKRGCMCKLLSAFYIFFLGTCKAKFVKKIRCELLLVLCAFLCVCVCVCVCVCACACMKECV